MRPDNSLKPKPLRGSALPRRGIALHRFSFAGSSVMDITDQLFRTVSQDIPVNQIIVGGKPKPLRGPA